MKKSKFEYKRIDDRLEIDEVSNWLEDNTNDGWEIIYYFEDMVDKNTILVRAVLKRPIKKEIL